MTIDVNIDRIKQDAMANGTFMKAPNGNTTNLSEPLWLQVRSESFKKQFGDWLNDTTKASKVVDKNGEPMVLYHGSKVAFTEFKSGTALWEGKADQIPGMYFTDSKDGATFFMLDETNPKFMKEVYVSLRNPLIVESKKQILETYGVDKLSEAAKKIKKDGYDGVITEKGLYAYGGPHKEIIAFNPEQIILTANNDLTKNSTIKAEVSNQNSNAMESAQNIGSPTEQPLNYKEYMRQYHEKDLATAVDFVGKNKDFTTEAGMAQLSFLEGHYNLLTTKESSVIMGKVNSAYLKEMFPDLYERVSSNVAKDNPLSAIKATVEQVKQHGGAWTFDDVRNVKTQEAALLTRDHPSSEFFAMRHDYNRSIAYQLNATADIKVFMEDAGYKQKQSTERWARYERGDTVLLVTDSNGFKNVKTGETGNLFKFIEAEYSKMGNKTATAHFIDVVMQQPNAEMRSKAHVEWLGERTQPSAVMAAGAPAAKKEFNLSEYRLEQLSTANNYLVNQRQIDKATLDSPVFKGSIIQGNKTHRMVNGSKVEIPKYLNNVVYPFKPSPEATNQEMTSLLQQYGKKFQVGGVMTDKLFAPGDGKHHAAWFSNLPADGKVRHLFVVENPLDAVSHYQLHKPENPLYMATGGRPAAGQLQLIDEVAKKYGAERLHLSFDNDMAGHSFDTQYLASKTQQVGLRQVPNSNDKEFIVEYKQLKPEQEVALKEVVKDMPNVKKDEKGAVQVHVKTPEELAKCNKYAVEYLHNDKSLNFTKSKEKDWNDDLKAFKVQNMAQSLAQNQNRDIKKMQGKAISR